jgi:Polyketide cyclase / dehydrase and lipid transport
MRALRFAGLTLAGLVTGMLVLAALLPSQYSVSRSIIIANDAASLTARLADLSTREAWVPWKQQEPNALFRSAGQAGIPGSTFSWSGKQIGEGTVTLVRVTGASEVETRIDFRKPMAMVARDRFLLTPAGAGTRVEWRNEGTLAYPVGRLFGLVIDNVVGSDYEKGLVLLKRVSENEAVAAR